MNKIYNILNKKGVAELSNYLKNKYNCDFFDELQITIMTKGTNAMIDMIYNRLNIKNELADWLKNKEIAFKEVDNIYNEFIDECDNKISKEKFKVFVCDRYDMKLSRKINQNKNRFYIFVPRYINTKSKK